MLTPVGFLTDRNELSDFSFGSLSIHLADTEIAVSVTVVRNNMYFSCEYGPSKFLNFGSSLYANLWC